MLMVLDRPMPPLASQCTNGFIRFFVAASNTCAGMLCFIGETTRRKSQVASFQEGANPTEE